MSVTAVNYGAVTVVRNDALPAALASADGPEGIPVIVSMASSATDGELIRAAVVAAEDAWHDAGSMPAEVRANLDRVIEFDPLRLLLHELTAHGENQMPRIYSYQ